ncbi:hypothetical protein SFRURICE_007725 [Spodoptera frugiperda]|nr:hypothetical protein SFRURICE_007725 [Spodoptera frugiperda]
MNIIFTHTHTQLHAFYPRRGRQRCTLRHVMPLYNVHPLFTIFVLKSHNTVLLRIFTNNRKSQYNLPDGMKHREPCSAVALATTRPTRQSRQRYTLLHVMPLNNVLTFHHLCYKSHVIGDEPIALHQARFETP